ncbi:MAG: hypothetical protein QXU81_10275 [Candidatus Bathyarchaeia archaeon]
MPSRLDRSSLFISVSAGGGRCTKDALLEPTLLKTSSSAVVQLTHIVIFSMRTVGISSLASP